MSMNVTRSETPRRWNNDHATQSKDSVNGDQGSELTAIVRRKDDILGR